LLATKPTKFQIHAYEKCETGACIMGITSIFVKGHADILDYFTLEPDHGTFWMGWDWNLMKETEAVGFLKSREFVEESAVKRVAVYRAVQLHLEWVIAEEEAALLDNLAFEPQPAEEPVTA